jgi:Na+/melibiose symporter-like transporter
MSNERNGYRTALVLFAVAVIIAILMAFATTLERIDTRIANNETAPGTTGLAKARPPLDRAPGKPVFGK